MTTCTFTTSTGARKRTQTNHRYVVARRSDGTVVYRTNVLNRARIKAAAYNGAGPGCFPVDIIDTDTPEVVRQPGIVARCQDGQVRHPSSFRTMREAQKWAWWGHACAAEHTYETIR